MDESHQFDPDKDIEMKETEVQSSKKNAPTAEQLTAIKAAIQNAGTDALLCSRSISVSFLQRH